MNTSTSESANRLRISEIFYSLQGESATVGIPTVFIRLTGCPLRCGYCDTTYAFQGGEWMGFDSILTTVAQYDTRYITVTGGEPLAQKNCLSLLTQLCDRDFVVSLETSGAIDVSQVDHRVVKVMDVKTPGSLESKRNLPGNLAHLTSQDQVKFVICDRADYDWAVKFMQEYDLSARCHVLFSPSHDKLSITDLAGWVLSDQLPVRVQIQLHKVIWGNEPGR